MKLASITTLIAGLGMLFWVSTAQAATLDPQCAAEVLAAHTPFDSDTDGLTDDEERCKYFTDANKADTDDDGYKDSDEIKNSYSPLSKGKKLDEVDSDADGLNDAWEIALGTGLMNSDSDADGFKDGLEVDNGFDPLNSAPVKVEKRIDVSTKKLSLTYTFGTTTLETIPVSTGKKSTPTPKGDFTILKKVPTKWYAGPTWNYPNTKWSMLFTSKKGLNYYIHGAYWHDKFGKSPVSGGCVNVRYADMGRLYEWAQLGTKVHVE